MRNEQELDFLEQHIPELAQNATQKAYFDTLSQGDTVLEAIDGKIYKISPDGSREFVKESNAPIKMTKRRLVIQ